MDGRGHSYSLHPLCHILFLFSQLFHLDAVRYMWLHCWPPTSAYRLMYRYCGLEAFAYVIKPIVPVVQNISCQAALKLFFFLVLCIMYHNQSLHHTLHSSVYKKCSLQGLLESKLIQSHITLYKTYCSLKGKPPSCTNLLRLEFVCLPNQKREFSSRA